MKKILTIHEAYNLYVLLKPVFPETTPEDDLLKFLLDLISNIRQESDMILVEVVGLLSGKEPDKIIEMADTDEFLTLLLDGFIENRIVDLMAFFDGIIK